MATQINNIYDYFTNIGVKYDNDLVVTRDLTLISKQCWLIRAIQNLLANIPIFCNCCDNTQLSTVIHSVKSAAIHMQEPEQTQRAAFIVSVLERLQKGRDPHLRSLALLNSLSHRIATTSQLTAVQKINAESRLNDIRTQYEHSEDDVIRALGVLEYQYFQPDDPVQAHRNHPVNPQPPGDPNQQLILAVKGIKNGVALGVGLINPIAGLLIAASTISESPQDLNKIDDCLARGANIDYQDASGYTPLIYAAYYGYPNIAAHLVRSGASVEIKERSHYNAYTMAQYYVNQYTKSLHDNDLRAINDNFTADDQCTMRNHYRETISRYQQVVDLLRPITQDQVMPQPSWWF